MTIFTYLNAKDINKKYNDFKTWKLKELYECERELFIVSFSERYREKECRDTVLIYLCLSKLSKIHIIAMHIWRRQCRLPRLPVPYLYTWHE